MASALINNLCGKTREHWKEAIQKGGDTHKTTDWFMRCENTVVRVRTHEHPFNCAATQRARALLYPQARDAKNRVRECCFSWYPWRQRYFSGARVVLPGARRILLVYASSHTQPTHTKPKDARPTHTRPNHAKPTHAQTGPRTAQGHPAHTRPAHTHVAHTHTLSTPSPPKHAQPTHAQPLSSPGPRTPNPHTTHITYQLILSVHVDDIKMGGKRENLKPKWQMWRQDVDLENPTPSLKHVYSDLDSNRSRS